MHSQEDYAPDLQRGNFSFAHPTAETEVEGTWLFADPRSSEDLAQKLVAEIKAVKENAPQAS